MWIYDANWWDMPKKETKIGKELKLKCEYKNRKKNLKRGIVDRLIAHNDYMIQIAVTNATIMRLEPSELEKKMQNFLDNQKVSYEFQKIIYIKDKRGWIKKFYIIDFYIPTKNMAIETDGKFHEERTLKDEQRTKDIRAKHPNIKIVRWKWHDFNSLSKMRNLIKAIK